MFEGESLKVSHFLDDEKEDCFVVEADPKKGITLVHVENPEIRVCSIACSAHWKVTWEYFLEVMSKPEEERHFSGEECVKRQVQFLHPEMTDEDILVFLAVKGYKAGFCSLATPAHLWKKGQLDEQSH